MTALPPQILPGGAGIQGEFLGIEDLPDSFYAEEEHPGMGVANYTASRFFLKRPDDYRLCVGFLAAGDGLLRIARLLKVHHQTVAAVREREGSEIDIQKERIRKNIRAAVSIAAERLQDIMARLSDGQVPLATAILIDKLRDLDGEPTHRVEVTHRGHLTHEAVAASLQAFPEAIEIEALPIGLEAGTAEQKGFAPGPAVGGQVPAQSILNPDKSSAPDHD